MSTIRLLALFPLLLIILCNCTGISAAPSKYADTYAPVNTPAPVPVPAQEPALSAYEMVSITYYSAIDAQGQRAAAIAKDALAAAADLARAVSISVEDEALAIQRTYQVQAVASAIQAAVLSSHVDIAAPPNYVPAPRNIIHDIAEQAGDIYDNLPDAAVDDYSDIIETANKNKVLP
jgi:hypothetical protein